MSELVKYTGGPVKIHTLDEVVRPSDVRRRLLLGTVVSRPVARYNLCMSQWRTRTRSEEAMAGLRATLAVILVLGLRATLAVILVLGAPFALLLLVLFYQVVPR